MLSLVCGFLAASCTRPLACNNCCSGCFWDTVMFCGNKSLAFILRATVIALGECALFFMSPSFLLFKLMWVAVVMKVKDWQQLTCTGSVQGRFCAAPSYLVLSLSCALELNFDASSALAPLLPCSLLLFQIGVSQEECLLVSLVFVIYYQWRVWGDAELASDLSSRCET